MGLMDRDYMRERRAAQEAPFRPRQTQTSTLWMVVVWTGIAFLLFKVYGWYGEHRPEQRRHLGTPVLQQGEHAERPHLRTSPAEVDAPPAPAQPSLALQQPEPRAEPQEVRQIYLCRAYNGGTFWAQTHCQQHRALIERITPVPPGLSFDQQVAIARQQRTSAQAVAVAAVPAQAQPAQPQFDRAAVCSALEAEIKAIDARARQPLPAYVQDRLAARRKDARSEQFRLRC